MRATALVFALLPACSSLPTVETLRAALGGDMGSGDDAGDAAVDLSPACPGCCNNDSDCFDGNPCTLDVCDPSAHTCSHPKLSNCCNSNADCPNISPCSTMSCDVPTHSCFEVTATPGCCTSDSDCTNGTACQTGHCDTSVGACQYTQIPGCCDFDAGCTLDDGGNNVVDGAPPVVDGALVPDSGAVHATSTGGCGCTLGAVAPPRGLLACLAVLGALLLIRRR
jgi:MYXO-CTERM domain-containing protein